jgi:hypothetical protein
MTNYIKNLLVGLAVLTVAGIVICTIGKIVDFSTIENIGKTASCLGIIGLIICLLVYLKLRELDNEKREINLLDKVFTPEVSYKSSNF